MIMFLDARTVIDEIIPVRSVASSSSCLFLCLLMITRKKKEEPAVAAPKMA